MNNLNELLVLVGKIETWQLGDHILHVLIFKTNIMTEKNGKVAKILLQKRNETSGYISRKHCFQPHLDFNNGIKYKSFQTIIIKVSSNARSEREEKDY